MQSEAENLISVVMGVRYRREDLSLLKRAVRSVLNQTHSNLELIICENGSTTGAISLLKAFAAEDSRVRLIDGTDADTLAKKLNRGIRVARGQWIGRQDDDDRSHPERFAQQLVFLQQNPNIAFVGCQVSLEQDNISAGERRFPERPTVRDFLFTQPFVHPALLFRHAALELVSGYNEMPQYDGCEDYELLLRLYSLEAFGANLSGTYFTYTLPPSGTDNRTFRMRMNEVQTRWVRFHSLGLLPRALPYVIKPLLAGMIPPALRRKINRRIRAGGNQL